MDIIAMLLCDAYKIGHPFQYPENTTLVYSNLTPRKSRIKGVDKMVVFGVQCFCMSYLVDTFNDTFFNLPKEYVISTYKRRVKSVLGEDLPTYQHIEDLWELGYLPLEIKALPEGSIVDMKVPILTIKNTLPKFYWLTNFIETLMSNVLWQPCTSATIAHEYKKILTKYAKLTGMPLEFVQWQGHDFSMRGMGGLDSAVTSAMGHLLSFYGTDTIPAIDALEQFYGANSDKEIIGGSVPATEHSVMCSYGKETEIETFKRLITKVYPKGIVSIVSDTWDLWKVVTEYVSVLKPEILARDGKVVIRPDSGDPVKIITGLIKDVEYEEYEGKYYKLKWSDLHEEYISTGEEVFLPEIKGVIECLWDVFGGTITDKGYKLLDSHIGAIYGDSITMERAEQICQRLMDKGFASQMVFGIGSFTYQYNTRDTFGIAMKATYIEIEGIGREIFKDPITDDGTKKSAKGLIAIKECVKPYKNDIFSGRLVHDKFELVDQVSWEEESKGALKTVFKDGKIYNRQKLSEIRKRLDNHIN